MSVGRQKGFDQQEQRRLLPSAGERRRDKASDPSASQRREVAAGPDVVIKCQHPNICSGKLEISEFEKLCELELKKLNCVLNYLSIDLWCELVALLNLKIDFEDVDINVDVFFDVDVE